MGYLPLFLYLSAFFSYRPCFIRLCDISARYIVFNSRYKLKPRVLRVVLIIKHFLFYFFVISTVSLHALSPAESVITQRYVPNAASVSPVA